MDTQHVRMPARPPGDRLMIGEGRPAEADCAADELTTGANQDMAAALATGAALLIGGIVLAGALGWIQPACGGLLVARTATCRGVSQSWTTIRPAVTPDWSRYRLDPPAAQEQPAPSR